MKARAVVNCNRSTAVVGSAKGFRINGRTSNEFRTPQISFGKTFGSCEVILQPSTRVLTQISSSIGEPMDSRPGEGILTVSVWISPAATGDMGGGGSQKPALIARTIEKLFKEHRVVDLESLCIKYGEKVWVLRADVHILDMNGCLAEAAALSVLGGLLMFRRPETYIDKETDQLVVLSLDESTPTKVHLHHLPILISFLVDGQTILAEPDLEEEEIFPGKIVIGVNDSKELAYLHLTSPISNTVLTEITRIAKEKCLERVQWLKSLAEEEDVRRNRPYFELKQYETRGGTVLQIPLSLFEKNDPATVNNEMGNLTITSDKKAKITKARNLQKQKQKSRQKSKS